LVKIKTVKWLHGDNIEGICENSGICYNVTNDRYIVEIYVDKSILSIRDSTHSFDQGLWSCEMDGQWRFSNELVVYCKCFSLYQYTKIKGAQSAIEENIYISRMKYIIYLFFLHFKSVDLCVN
jgi:hypothetical protein